MTHHADFYTLEQGQQEKVDHWISRFFLCQRENQFRQIMAEIITELGCRYWAAGVCRLQGDFQVTSDYHALYNYPEVILGNYISQQMEFVDLVATRIFVPDFGQLQRWSTVYEEISQNPGPIPPSVVEMYRNWRSFLLENQVVPDGYSVGARHFNEGANQWFGSYMCFNEFGDYSQRNRAILNSIKQAQHLALYRLFEERFFPKESS